MSVDSQKPSYLLKDLLIKILGELFFLGLRVINKLYRLKRQRLSPSIWCLSQHWKSIRTNISPVFVSFAFLTVFLTVFIPPAYPTVTTLINPQGSNLVLHKSNLYSRPKWIRSRGKCGGKKISNHSELKSTFNFHTKSSQILCGLRNTTAEWISWAVITTQSFKRPWDALLSWVEGWSSHMVAANGQPVPVSP